MRGFWAGAAIAAAVLLAACGGDGERKAKADDGPKDLRAKMIDMDPTAATDFIIDQVRSGPGGPRACDFVHELALLGDVPADAAAHAGHAGARAWTVQCGTPGAEGAARWIVYLSASDMTAAIEPCTQNGADICAQSFIASQADAVGVPPDDSGK